MTIKVNPNERLPLFVCRDSDGFVTGMYQASKADRTNWKMVYSIARHECELGGSVSIQTITGDKISKKGLSK